jgi:hypothetical protein
VSINVLVFVLAARSGWSRLALASVLLTAVAWSSAVATDHWSWPLEIGLSALFLALGAAPLPRLARSDGRVRPVDLALIAAAPVALIAASWPMFALARSEHVALLLGALAAAYLGLAWAVDRIRPERDLWRPITAAATLFLTVALERSVGPENTGLAWAVEGVVLAWLGLSPRSGWLRTCGSAVAFAAACRVLPGMFSGPPERAPAAARPPAGDPRGRGHRGPALRRRAARGGRRHARRALDRATAGSAVPTCCWRAGSRASRITWRGRSRGPPGCGARSPT